VVFDRVLNVTDRTTSGYIKLKGTAVFKIGAEGWMFQYDSSLHLIAGNAEMTELFRCHKSGTQCCAPKSMIREMLDQKHGGSAQARNETFPPHYRPPPAALVPGEGTFEPDPTSFKLATLGRANMKCNW
jgi:hypothetical protein